MTFTEYRGTLASVNYPDGFFETLQGLSLEEQATHFCLSASSRILRTGWGERDTKYTRTLADCAEVRSVLVKDGYIVGVLVEDELHSEVALLPECGVCTYSASDNNGAGYVEREDYLYLVCIRP